MTINELREILNDIPVESTQVTFTLGSKQFRVKEVTWIKGSLLPIEIKLEEIKE